MSMDASTVLCATATTSPPTLIEQPNGLCPSEIPCRAALMASRMSLSASITEDPHAELAARSLTLEVSCYLPWSKGKG